MLNPLIHRKLFVFFLVSLAVGLTMGKLIMSISMIGLSVNWLFEGRFKRKWEINKSRGYVPLIFLGLFFVELIWLFFAEDLSPGINSIRIKLPLLVLPIVLGTSQRINKKEIKIIVISFLIGIAVSSLVAFGVDIGWISKKTITGTSRDISIFMSHIRYSLVLVFANFLIIHLIIKEKINKLFALIFSIWIFLFIYKMASLTAFVSLLLGFLFYFINWVSIVSSKKKKQIILLFLCSFTFLISALGLIIKDYYTAKEPFSNSVSPHRTQMGEKYIKNRHNYDLENGYYVWNNIAVNEISQAWNERSTLPFNETDLKGQTLQFTLYRFLTSKGLKKDKSGLDKITDDEIRLVEQGNTTAVSYNKIEKRIREVLFELENFRKTKDPNNHSVTQRVLYWKTGLNIIQNSIIIGQGTGGVKKAYKNYYQENTTILNKKNQRLAHNQFLTQFINLGIFGFSIWLFIFLLPSIRLLRIKGPLFLSFLCSMVIAFFSDDMIERQAGVTIFATIFYLFVFSCSDIELKGLFLLKKDSK